MNISLGDEQRRWLDARQREEGFSSASDVVRELIRERQKHEQDELRRAFEAMDARDGSNEPEPEREILKIVKQVKKERRAKAASRS